MRTLLPFVVVSLSLSACFLHNGGHRDHAVVKHVEDDDEDDRDGHPPLLAYIPMQRLHETIDGSMQASTHLDRVHIAGALETIADAMDAFVRHDPEAVEAIRANVALLRKPLKAKRQAEVVRRALDAALAALRTHESGRTFDDIERASGRIEGISPTQSLAQQSLAVRYALCAVGNAVSMRAETGRLRCISMGTEVTDNSQWQAASTQWRADALQGPSWQATDATQTAAWQAPETPPAPSLEAIEVTASPTVDPPPTSAMQAP